MLGERERKREEVNTRAMHFWQVHTHTQDNACSGKKIQ